MQPSLLANRSSDLEPVAVLVLVLLLVLVLVLLVLVLVLLVLLVLVLVLPLERLQDLAGTLELVRELPLAPLAAVD